LVNHKGDTICPTEGESVLESGGKKESGKKPDEEPTGAHYCVDLRSEKGKEPWGERSEEGVGEGKNRMPWGNKRSKGNYLS